MISNSVIHLQSYTNSAITNIAGNSARAPLSPHQAPRSPHRAPISLHQMANVREFCDVSQCVKRGSLCFMTFYKFFIMFYNVLRCLASHATIGIASATVRPPIASGIGDNSAEIGDNSTEIGDDTAGIGDIAAKVIPC